MLTYIIAIEGQVVNMNSERFVKAQESSYETALEEIRNERKVSCWMWYIFPQIKGLGSSPTAVYYSIEDRAEAEEYINHPLLGQRLREISALLLETKSSDADFIFGYPDNMKLRSSMTLFYLVSGEELFKKVIDKFFEGKLDACTVRLLGNDKEN